ncbi:MAG: calcium-binding protein [Waterburya sp.]
MSSIIIPIDPSGFVGDGLDLVGADGFNAIFGTAKGDFIDARAGNDLIDGGRGDDLIKAGLGSDFVLGGSGDDIIFGEGGNDVIYGGNGNDSIDGGEGNDVIFGGNGDDSILGGLGDDTIFGDKGNDTIIGGSGNDVLFGGKGEDVFAFDASDFSSKAISRVEDFTVGQDSLVIEGISSDAQLAFDSKNGILYYNGNAVLDLKNVGDISDMDVEKNRDGGFELM